MAEVIDQGPELLFEGRSEEIEVEDDSEEDDEESDWEEEEEQPQEPAETPLPAVMEQQDPRRMHISREHRDLALRYKAAAAQITELNALPDFWYVQCAIAIGDNIPVGLHQLIQLQSYREEYNIVDTFEFGRRCLRDIVELLPGYFMGCDFNKTDGNYMFALDFAKADMGAVRRSPQAWFQGCYFVAQVAYFEFEAVRKGVTLVMECEGYDWGRNLDFNIIKQIWLELCAVYPLHLRQVRHFHTGVFMNLMVSMSKKFLPASLGDNIQMGCKFKGGRMDQFYNVPSLEAAQERLLSRLEMCLAKRYINEHEFRLS